ncbi:hypothetical protein JTB14_002936 [Gonioctena quinquepunctata]|nr:hypothetical protein JTB14_002936 [Gonioctena quinquepunctata]
MKIKEALDSAPILSSADFTKPFVIECDSSDTGVGKILLHNIEGKYNVEIQSTADLEVVPRDRDPYVSDINSLKDVFDEVRSSLHKSYKKNDASHYNLRHRDVSFEVGDEVYRRNTFLSKAADEYCAEPENV